MERVASTSKPSVPITASPRMQLSRVRSLTGDGHRARPSDAESDEHRDQFGVCLDGLVSHGLTNTLWKLLRTAGPILFADGPVRSSQSSTVEASRACARRSREYPAAPGFLLNETSPSALPSPSGSMRDSLEDLSRAGSDDSCNRDAATVPRE
jgi:hypothetical protein